LRIGESGLRIAYLNVPLDDEDFAPGVSKQKPVASEDQSSKYKVKNTDKRPNSN
jgi:hypothetical protein